MYKILHIPTGAHVYITAFNDSKMFISLIGNRYNGMDRWTLIHETHEDANNIILQIIKNKRITFWEINGEGCELINKPLKAEFEIIKVK